MKAENTKRAIKGCYALVTCVVLLAPCVFPGAPCLALVPIVREAHEGPPPKRGSRGTVPPPWFEGAAFAGHAMAQ